MLRPSYTCFEVERGGELPLVGNCCGPEALVGGGRSNVVDLGTAGGVMVSGERYRPSEVLCVWEEGVGLLQAYGEASLRISGRPAVSIRGPLRLSRRLARSSSLEGGVECVSGDFFAEGTQT